MHSKKLGAFRANRIDKVGAFKANKTKKRGWRYRGTYPYCFKMGVPPSGEIHKHCNTFFLFLLFSVLSGTYNNKF